VVDRLALGTGADAAVVTNVRGIAMEGSASVLEGKLGVHVGGLISHQFFRRHALTLDFQNMGLILHQSRQEEVDGTGGYADSRK